MVYDIRPHLNNIFVGNFTQMLKVLNFNNLCFYLLNFLLFIGVHFLIFVFSTFYVYFATLFYLSLLLSCCMCPGFSTCPSSIHLFLWLSYSSDNIVWSNYIPRKKNQALIVSKPILMIYIFSFKSYSFLTIQPI